MSYYGQAAGDYRTYGYGQGDPGFLSRLWKGVKGLVVPAVATAVGGPILGGIARAGMQRPKMTPPIRAGVAQPRQDLRLRMGPIAARSTDFFPPVPQFVGGPMTPHERMASSSAAMAGTGCCPRGFHLAKDGSGKCVRNRRMNVANPRALRRSMRRVQGFEKLARRTISFTRRVKMKK
ncbi:MAG: hypothetical protein V3S55_15745, partial [Nitrospiraceae bacterium]